MMLFTIISIALGVGFALWRITKRTRFFLHTFQLFGYKQTAFLPWVSERLRDVLVRTSHLVGLGVVSLGWLIGIPVWALYLLWALAFASSKRYRRDRPKKGLVWTPRMKRLASLTASLSVLVMASPYGVFLFFGPALGASSSATTGPLAATGLSAALAWLIGFGLADLLAPYLVYLASLILIPVEKQVQEGFKSQARKHLALRPDLSVVAITGSYGKTSVKFAVQEILAQRFPTLATPGSYNTPMGICKVVNDLLTDEHRFAVLEMGMRHPGDIAELCNIARPDIAIVTSVGPAHLEYMGSIEAIAAEKASILSFLPPNGVAILNLDDPYVREMRSKFAGKVVGVSVEGMEADFTLSSIQYGTDGARFTVHTPSESHPFSTTLLGRHNLLNILLAVAVGHEAGMSLRQMSHAIARLKPIDHRLKLNHRGGLIVLDDAFNSNPVGAANAVEVLAAFTPRRRIVVTPGMIELGDLEADYNRTFGVQLAAGADDVILVGPSRTQPIAEGLRQAAFPEDRVHVVHSLFEAQDWIAAHAKPGDVVLYENDLPDQFNEA